MHTPRRRFDINAPTTGTRVFAESFAPVDPIVLHAMSWAAELGVSAVGAATGAALRLFATVCGARAIVEIGTGTGVSGLWLLRGLRADGVLTSIDIDPDHQDMARQSFAAAGFPDGSGTRARLISGRARDVLPRLADGAYDLVFVDGDVDDYAHCVTAAHRLLRLGGLVVVNNALADDDAVRAVVAQVRESALWSPALFESGTGLLCAAKLST
jgi:predicted O-methyltransferase YrrM